MEIQKIFDVFLYAVPALITGIVAFYFFKEHTKNEDGRRRFLLHKDLQVKQTDCVILKGLKLSLSSHQNEKDVPKPSLVYDSDSELISML